MGTATPVFPKGRLGMVPASFLFPTALSAAFTKGPVAATIEPAPNAPTVFKNVRRVLFSSLFDIGLRLRSVKTRCEKCNYITVS